MIEFKNVFKFFGKDKVLSGVDFSVLEGEFAILIGHNGVGKSTILNLIVQNEFHDSGSIFIQGQDIDDPHYFHQKQIAFIHEKLNFKLPMVMQKFVDVYKNEFPDWDEDLFQKMIFDRKLNLNKKFTEYSRGQKMQIALIIALSRKPKILLMDEITSVLDLPGQKYFLSYLREYAKAGNTVLLTTNIIAEAQNFCDKVVMLSEGKVEFVKKKQDLFKDYIKLEIENHKIPHYPWLSLGIMVEEIDDKKYFVFPRKGNLHPGIFVKEVPLSLEDVFIFKYQFEKEANDAHAA